MRKEEYDMAGRVQDSAEAEEGVLDAFRLWGYLQAQVDSFGGLQPVPIPELEVTGDVANRARRYYCGSIGV